MGRTPNEVARHHWIYLGGVDTADWKRVLEQETIPLEPGEKMVFTNRTTRFHDQPLINRHISKFDWQFRLKIGDGVWAKSNVIRLELVDLDVQTDGELVHSLVRPGAGERGGDAPTPDEAYPVRRLIVGEEQWVYFQNRRIATLPANLEPVYCWDPETFTYWLRFPDDPDRNLQREGIWPYRAGPERTPPKPEFLVPMPEEAASR